MVAGSFPDPVRGLCRLARRRRAARTSRRGFRRARRFRFRRRARGQRCRRRSRRASEDRGDGAVKGAAGMLLAAALVLPHAAFAQAQKPQAKPAPSPFTNAPSGVQIGTPIGEADLAYGAYQNGRYLTAFALAMKRAEALADPVAMTLLGELYANGLGVATNDQKAADWYKLAADRGDRNAMFALGMFRLVGRAGPADRAEAARLFQSAADRGHAAAAYNLALLYLEGQVFPQDFAKAAQL